MWNKILKFFSIGAFIVMMTACQSMAPPKPEAGPDSSSKTTTELISATEDKKIIPPEEIDAAGSLFKRAIQSARADKTDKAIEQFQQLVSLDPAYKHAFTNLGLLLLNRGKNESAKKALLNAIDQDKHDSIAYNHLAIIERQQGSFKQAMEYYKKAIDANPDYANAHLNLGILLDIYLQDLPEAQRHYKTYQEMTGKSDKKIGKWLLDIQRRIEANNKKAKG